MGALLEDMKSQDRDRSSWRKSDCLGAKSWQWLDGIKLSWAGAGKQNQSWLLGWKNEKNNPEESSVSSILLSMKHATLDICWDILVLKNIRFYLFTLLNVLTYWETLVQKLKCWTRVKETWILVIFELWKRLEYFFWPSLSHSVLEKKTEEGNTMHRYLTPELKVEYKV